MASIREPLQKLNKKNTNWTWKPEHESAFRKAKSVIFSLPSLTFCRTEAEQRLVVDGSPCTSGAVSLQKDGNNWIPAFYSSEVFSEVEQRYAQIEPEALAIYNGLIECHNYIYGKRFTVVTDHKPLLGVFNKQTGSAYENTLYIYTVNIVDHCADYDFELTFQPGPASIADVLSRLHKSALNDESEIENEFKVGLVRSCGSNSSRKFRDATLADKEIQSLTAAIQNEL